jgi:hypothetical protein
VGRDPSVVPVQHRCFADRCCHAGVQMPPGGAHGVRAVTHFDVGEADAERVADVFAHVLLREAA